MTNFKEPPPRPRMGSPWLSPLFFKCLFGIMAIFFIGSFGAFTLGGLSEKNRLKREMEPANIEKYMRQGLAGVSSGTLQDRAASPFCGELLQSLVSELLNEKSQLWKRYNRSLAFPEDFFLILRYKSGDTYCQYTTDRIGDLLMPRIDEAEAEAMASGRPAHLRPGQEDASAWVSVVSLPFENQPEAVLTLGIQLDTHLFRTMFPELKAAGWVLMHLSTISFLSALLLAVYVVRRIRRAEKAAAQWALGNLSVRINDKDRDEFGRLAATFDYMADALSKNIEVKQSLAAAEERNRLARDLHDTAKQRCFVLGLRLSLLARICADNHKQAELVRSALDLTRLVQGDLADVIQRFSWPTIAQAGLLKATTDSLELLLSGSSIHWALELKPEDAAILESETHWAGQLLMITTEAAANVLRHSRAENMRVSFSRSGGQGVWTIEDDGCGFDVKQASGQGMGLSNMKQRAEICPNGRLKVESRVGLGTALTITFDVPTSQESEL